MNVTKIDLSTHTHSHYFDELGRKSTRTPIRYLIPIDTYRCIVAAALYSLQLLTKAINKY